MKAYYKLVEFYDVDDDIKLVHIPTKQGADGEAIRIFKEHFPDCELIEVYNEDYMPQYEGLTLNEILNQSYELLNL